MIRREGRMRTTVKFWMTISMMLLVSACGYKPSSHVIQHVFSDTVYVEVLVDRAEPENAPYVKDEMNRLVYTRFKGRIVSKEEAQSQIRLSYAGSSFIPLSYENGYVTRYRAVIRVKFDMVTKAGRETKTISSIVESDIQASSLTSSALRIDAIRIGLGKALDEFLAYVSAKGMLKEVK
ncbi:LPS assembly lipoprotein LptE [Sulfurovum sp. XTW-4]|uniref:LPS assembly lipoprotein LptE n=1 Tax=Sulfurovum xiamenensis TaxID=3019066 RepID=A0ABT7QR26_9BACT|nr:LPS assembly lipoprotein LptE [Sulfurovum xiamenensis]MDM5262999.1 LPS assembly lipoprotein LptE [Sulfurovum xiamenensis]